MIWSVLLAGRLRRLWISRCSGTACDSTSSADATGSSGGDERDVLLCQQKIPTGFIEAIMNLARRFGVGQSSFSNAFPIVRSRSHLKSPFRLGHQVGLPIGCPFLVTLPAHALGHRGPCCPRDREFRPHDPENSHLLL